MPDRPSPSSVDEAVHAITAGLDYPMTVVTATAGGERAGCLVGFTTQCSIDPVRFAVWVSKANHTHRLAAAAPALAVHLLARDQHGLAALFGEMTEDRDDKFSRCAWHDGPLGTTILDDCTRWFAGPVLDHQDGGDHTGFLVEPSAAAAGPWPGQLSFRMVQDLSPGHPA